MHIYTQNDSFYVPSQMRLRAVHWVCPSGSAASSVLSPLGFVPSASAAVFKVPILLQENWGSVRLGKWLESIELASDDAVIHSGVWGYLPVSTCYTWNLREMSAFWHTKILFPNPWLYIRVYSWVFPSKYFLSLINLAEIKCTYHGPLWIYCVCVRKVYPHECLLWCHLIGKA